MAAQTKDGAEAESTSTPRALKREQTRQRIYQAAMEEFARVGTAKAQISDIAKAAGVAYGSFYVHFDSKDEVLRECARRQAARIREELAAVSPEKFGSARDFFERVARAHLDAEIEVPEIRSEVWIATVRQPPSREQHPHIAALSHHLSALQERGLIRNDRPASKIALAFLTALIGILVRSTPELVNRATAAALVDIFADATAPPENASSA